MTGWSLTLIKLLDLLLLLWFGLTMLWGSSLDIYIILHLRLNDSPEFSLRLLLITNRLMMLEGLCLETQDEPYPPPGTAGCRPVLAAKWP